jgi:cysteine desulfurase
VAGTSNLGFEGVEVEGLVELLDQAGFAVSSGAACSSGSAKASHVLQAMGLSEGQAKGALRVSLSSVTTQEELEAFSRALAVAVASLRRRSLIG